MNDKNIDDIYKEMISQLCKNQLFIKKLDSRLGFPYFSVDLILNSWEMEWFIFDEQIVETLQTQINKVNKQIAKWIKDQAILMTILKKVAGDSINNKSSDLKAANSGFLNKEVWSKNQFWRYSEAFIKNNVKRPERLFTDAERAFKLEEWIQKVIIPWVDEWNLRFSIENEEEINQILYYGYKHSPFYNQEENKWYNDYTKNYQNKNIKDFNRVYANWTT